MWFPIARNTRVLDSMRPLSDNRKYTTKVAFLVLVLFSQQRNLSLRIIVAGVKGAVIPH